VDHRESGIEFPLNLGQGRKVLGWHSSRSLSLEITGTGYIIKPWGCGVVRGRSLSPAKWVNLVELIAGKKYLRMRMRD